MRALRILWRRFFLSGWQSLWFFMEGCAVVAREGRTRSVFDRSPSAPQVCIMGFLAALAQARGVSRCGQGGLGTVSIWPVALRPSGTLWVSLCPFFSSSKVRAYSSRRCAVVAREGRIGWLAARRPPPPRYVFVIPGAMLGARGTVERCAM